MTEKGLIDMAGFAPAGNDKFAALAQMFLMNNRPQVQQPVETVNIGGHNILVNRKSRPLNQITPALAQLTQGYLGMQQQQTRDKFLQDVQIIAKSQSQPDEKINQLLSLYSQHGTDYGLGVKDIMTQYQAMLETQGKKTKLEASTKRNDLIDSTKIREEFLNRPEIKEYVSINTQVKSMDSLLNNAKSGNIKNKVALDQGLITMYNKLTDPNSVVRESEYARTPENLPFANRFSGALERLQKGGAGLTDADREALVWGAKVIANERGKTFNDTLQGYVDLSGQYGIDESLITRGMKAHQDYSLLNKKVTVDNFNGQNSNTSAQTMKDKYGLR